MSSEPRYYNVESESKYRLVVNAVDILNVGDTYYTHEELEERFPQHYIGSDRRAYLDTERVKAELEKLTAPMRASETVRSVVIDDEELLAVLKDCTVRYFNYELGRRKNKLIRAPHGDAARRKQRAPMKRDQRALWMALDYAAHEHYNTWLPNIPRRLRTLGLFKLLKRAFTWSQVKARIHNKDQRRWCHMIWKSPQEYLK